MLEHGGDLASASRRWGIAIDDWLDLSTGINPNGWPVPAISRELWQRLPQGDGMLEEVAREYYGCRQLLPVAGSQCAIQWLPYLRPRGKVGVLAPTYAEHAAAWRRAGHEVIEVPVSDIEPLLETLDVVVVVNPNNPTGEDIAAAKLLAWRERLAAHHGWLVVDEAFRDATPHLSLAKQSHEAGLIVLRSLGKFFGLAGARVGFVLAAEELLAQLSAQTGPWPLAGPARFVAQTALRDLPWQRRTRQELVAKAQRLRILLSGKGLQVNGGTACFQWLRNDDALDIFESLAALGVLLRYFPAEQTGQAGLRFGLPGSEADWQRLEVALDIVAGSAVTAHDISSMTPG